MRKFLFRSLAAAALTFGGLAVVAPAASASTGPGGTECASNKTSNTWYSVCFQKTGEIFWVKDNQSDGERVSIDWHVYGTKGDRTGKLSDSLGTSAGWTSYNYNFGNDQILQYYAYTQNGPNGGKNHYKFGGTTVST